MEMELAPVRIDELAERLLVALSCTHQQSLAHREILACPVPFVAITTNDPRRGRKKVGPTPSCSSWCLTNDNERRSEMGRLVMSEFVDARRGHPGPGR